MDIFFFRAETNIHVGAGQSTGSIDLPVMREKTTGIPIIPGSGMKGALRQHYSGKKNFSDKIEHLFGPQSGENMVESAAGHLLISDARLLFLPIRMLEGSYKLVTCPLLLKRFVRDIKRTGKGIKVMDIPPDLNDIDDGTVYLCQYQHASGRIHLEEYEFKVNSQDALLEGMVKYIPFIQDDLTQLAVMSDDNFVWFANHALPVNARNKLNNETKVSNSLWYEETLPPETVLYNLIGSRSAEDGKADAFYEDLNDEYLVVGGNETIGQGWLKCERFPKEIEENNQ